MRHLDLFAGIGGFSLVASWMGWETVAQVEWDGYCQKVLAKNFPNVKRYGNIKEFDGTKYRGLIDIISGGFPCQGFSIAGKQGGKSDPRWLWPEMLRIIREIQSPWVIGENVPGIIKLALEDICTSLENEGYAVQPFIIPSASVGAWDKRERVWIIAYNGLPKADCNINIKSIQGYSWNELSEKERERDEIRRNGQANWSRPWVEIASELCGSNARISHRLDRIKALGNSVNPHVVFEIFKAIEQYNNLKS